LLSFLTSGLVFAQYMPKVQPGQYAKPQATSSAPLANTVGSPIATESGEVKGLLDIPGKVYNAVKSVYEALADCGANVFCYMAGGVEVVERKAVDQISGCGDVDNPDGYKNCQTKYQALLNGGTLADVKNPGSIFFLADVADRGFRMPVPIESQEYIATINPFQSSQVYAQAVDELNNGRLSSLWNNFRNAALALSAIIIVIIGFMIMFRSRLDPRTTITAMNSLPKVIFAVILTYFSFALSGLMLDFGRLALQFVYQLVPLESGAIFSGLLQLVLLIILLFVGSFFTGGVTGLVGIGLLLLVLLILILLMVVIVNILIQMLKRYAAFIIYTLAAPFFFLWGALPGQSMLGWFKSQLANVLAIPAMFLMVRLAVYIGSTSFNVIGNILGHDIGGATLSLPSPFAVGLGTSTAASATGWFLLAPLVSIGVLFYATKMPAILDGVLGIKDYGAQAGFGPMAVIAAPVAALNKANKAIGPLSNITSAAVQRSGFIGRIASPLHTAMRAINDQKQSYIPSVSELKAGAVQKQVSSGREGWVKVNPNDAIKKEYVENFVKSAPLTPGIDPYVQAERSYSQLYDSYIASGGTAPALAPNTPVEKERWLANEQNKYRDELLSQGAPADIAQNEVKRMTFDKMAGPRKKWDPKTKRLV